MHRLLSLFLGLLLNLLLPLHLLLSLLVDSFLLFFLVLVFVRDLLNVNGVICLKVLEGDAEDLLYARHLKQEEGVRYLTDVQKLHRENVLQRVLLVVAHEANKRV
jgi:hypothetical protein